MGFKEKCIYPIWLDSSFGFSIFQGFVFIALCLVGWLLHLTWRTFHCQRHIFWIFIIISGVLLALWMNNLHKLKLMMDTEKGEMQTVEFFKITGMTDEEFKYIKMMGITPIKCKP